MFRSIAQLSLILGLASVSWAQPTSQPAAEPMKVQQQTLFAEGKGASNNYRIPALLVTKKGTVLAFCEGRQTPRGPHNDSGEINLIVRRSVDGGKTFAEPSVVWADGKNTCGNPCPVVDESTGQILMLMTHNLGEDNEKEINLGTSKESRTAWICTSDDDGVTWSKPRDITQEVKKPEWGWYATGPGVGIQIQHGPHAGRLIIPCDYGNRGKDVGPGNSHVIYSDDHGKSWHIGGEPPEHAFNESQIVELADGTLMFNLRNTGRANPSPGRGIAISTDGGETFAPSHADDVLIEPHCQGSIARYSWPQEGKSRLLFANPASSTERKRMTVKLSYDDGKTWPISKLIYPGWSGYSSIARLPDGSIGLLYEAGNEQRYERIDFARFTLDQLTDGTDSTPAH